MSSRYADWRNAIKRNEGYDDAFTDREREIRELKADARNGQNVVLFAPRRFGKSSLVWRVAADLVRSGVLVAQVDLMRTPSKERFAAALARTIHDDIASRVLRTRERLRVFAGLRVTPTVTVDPVDGSVSFSFVGGTQAEDIDATIERLLELPAQLAAEPGRPLAAEYRRRHGLPAPSTVQKALTALEGDELVVREPALGYRIMEPFLAEWVRGHAQ